MPAGGEVPLEHNDSTHLGEHGLLSLTPFLRPRPAPNLEEPHAPRLAVSWETRRRNFVTSLLAVLRGPLPPRDFLGEPYFRDCWVRSPLPRRAFVATLLWHIVFVVLPYPRFPQRNAQSQLSLPQVELTYLGPIADLPPLLPVGPSPVKPSPPGEPNQPLPRRGADAFHPRQTIISAPKVPTHPRQTLIQPNSPPEPPKILPPLPDIVQWADVARPARPRLRISPADLAKLRPKQPAMRSASEVPIPEVPNQEKQAGDLNIAASKLDSAKPLLPMGPMAAPQLGPRQAGAAVPAPDILPTANAADAGAQRLIALSATPGPSAPPPVVPPGNLAARITISPEGSQPGTPGGSRSGSAGGTGGANVTAEHGGGNGPAGVSITGGNPSAASPVAGVGSGIGMRRPLSSLPAKPEPRLAAPAPDRNPPLPGFERIKPGAAPEELLGLRRIYTLHVNMPNMASATGSWVLNFSELGPPEATSGADTRPVDLFAPVPMIKVDPKYPPELASEHVEGEVVLFAIIRKDGSVDSIQLVKSLEPQLDQNAMLALARWKFRPAARKGQPVELEAVVHIPFRSTPPRY